MYASIKIYLTETFDMIDLSRNQYWRQTIEFFLCSAWQLNNKVNSRLESSNKVLKN